MNRVATKILATPLDLLAAGLSCHVGQEQFSRGGKVCRERQIFLRADSGQIRSEQLVKYNRAGFPVWPVR